MRKNNLFKTTAMTLAVLTMAVGMTACGNKTADNTDTQPSKETQVVVETSTKTNSEAVTTKTAQESTQDNTTEAITEEQTEVVVVDGSDNNVSEDTGSGNTDNGNTADTSSNQPVETPDAPSTPSEPEYVPDVPSEPEPTPEEPQPSVPEVITTVNPFDGKTYTYVAPEDMDYSIQKWSEMSAINGNADADWDYSCEFKTLTTRTFYQVDGTYTVLEGWYSRNGDFTATPLQIAPELGIDPNKDYASTIVGKFYDERKDCYRNVAFTYLRP